MADTTDDANAEHNRGREGPTKEITVRHPRVTPAVVAAVRAVLLEAVANGTLTFPDTEGTEEANYERWQEARDELLDGALETACSWYEDHKQDDDTDGDLDETDGDL